MILWMCKWTGEKSVAYHKKWYRKNREHCRELSKKWFSEHREEVKVKQREWFKKDYAMNPEKYHERHVRYYSKNFKKIQAYQKRYNFLHKFDYDRKQYLRAFHRRRRTDVIFHYSNGRMCCACCGERALVALSLHHKDGGGMKHRKEIGRGIHFYDWVVGNNFPPMFQVLCHNCNQGTEINGGWCYHWDDVFFQEGSIYPCIVEDSQGGILDMKNFSELEKTATTPALEGEKSNVTEILGKSVKVMGWKQIQDKFSADMAGKVTIVQVELNGVKKVFFTRSKVLLDQLVKNNDNLPFMAKVVKPENKKYLTFQ